MIEDRTELEKEYFAFLLQERLPFPDGYYMENDRFYFSIPISSNCKWDKDNKVWIDNRTLDEQLEYYKQEILKFNQELMIYEKSGFGNEELQIKLEELLKKHNDIAYDIATQENKMLNL